MARNDEDAEKKNADPRFDWPYATAYLLDTLDPELIEAHGERILSRALNIGRVIGFVGTGVSMSYGRISWQKLVESELVRINTRLSQAKDSAIWNTLKATDAKRLEATLETLKPARPDIRSDRYPMLFQVCEQLDAALTALDVPSETTTRGQAIRLTVDDEGHAYQILVDALLYDQPTSVHRPPSARPGERPRRITRRATEPTARRFIDGVLGGSYDPNILNAEFNGQARLARPSPVDKTAYRLFFECSNVEKLLRLVNAAIPGGLQKAVRKAVDCRPAGDDRRYLLPADRYLVGCLLHLAERSTDAWKLPASQWWSGIAGDIRSQRHGQPIAPASRHGLIAQWRDPLLLMQERLRISRYITTNYDHEIERLFRDQDFRVPHSTAPKVSLLRPTFEEIVFDNARSGELAAFSVRDRGRAGAVVHLHGRAEKNNPSSRIVVSEIDYQSRYLRDDASRKLVDDAIRLAFGSSPILFVGSNMGEDDLLRPLRQFMSGPSRVGDRVAVALVPAMGNRAHRTEDKIAHLSRYGVYTIHFGAVRVLTRRIDGELSEAVEWLPWIWQMRALLIDALRLLADPATDKRKSRKTNVEFAEPLLQQLAKVFKKGPETTPSSRLKGNEQALEELHDMVRSKDDCSLEYPAEIEARNVDRLELDAETDIISACLRWLLEQPTRIPNWPDHRRQARALLTAVEGAGDAILATFTSARLAKVRDDWDRWKDEWFRLPVPSGLRKCESPPPALTARRQGAESPVSHDALIAHRHTIFMPDRPATHVRLGRFYRGAPSQSYFGLLAALRSQGAADFRSARGRRLMILSGRRGLGKGHLFSSLEDCHGLADKRGLPLDPYTEPRILEFLRAFGQDIHASRKPLWTGLGFFNLSFSQEVMSAFDRTVDLLWSCLRKCDEKIAARVGYETLAADRLERMRAVLSGWNEFGRTKPDRNERVLVAFQGFSILFDQDGNAKNGQVQRICDLMFSSDYSAAPIDLILSCQENRVPRAFAGEFPQHKTIPLVREGIDARSRVRTERALQGTGIHLPEQHSAARSNPSAQQSPERTSVAAIHVLQEARAVVIAATYFPWIAVLVARHIIRGSSLLRGERGSFYPNVFERHSWAFRDAMRHALYRMQLAPAGALPKHFVPTAIVTIALLLESGAIKANTIGKQNSLVFILNKLLDETLRLAARAEFGDGERATFVSNAAAAVLQEYLLGSEPNSDEELTTHRIADELQKATNLYDAYMRSLFDAVLGGRFLLTLMFVGAEEILSGIYVSGDNLVAIDKIEEATQALIRVFDRTKRTLMGVPATGLSNVVIEEILSTMRRRSGRGEPLPIDLSRQDHSAARSGEQSDMPRAAVPALHRLMTEIVWHLSVIGQPAEQVVLERCPRIIEACNMVRDAGADAVWVDSVLIREAVDLAIHRSLIFPLFPRSQREEQRGPAGSNTGERRLAVHRLMQRYVFHSLGAPDVEFTEADQFTLSLYASQPDDLPRLTLGAHRQISQLIARLSGYPADRTAVAFATDTSPGAKQKLLRASLGVMRSIYSVAVLGRFDRQSDGQYGGPGREGYFEEHRRMVRWLIKAGVDLPRDGMQTSPFYAEEIVWLYNECAVLSLVEGRLTDAHALFDRAIAAALRLEPAPSGPLHVRVLLNKSICDIERGHSVEARGALQAIARMKNEHAVLPMLAQGYIGLIDHLAGEVSEAENNYICAINGLVKLRRSRAASIFSRHYGNLLSCLRQPRLEQARQAMEDAVHFAQEGGHEDIRHLALLSLCKFRLQQRELGDGANLHRELDAIDAYAHVVGMPRLLCEVALARTQLLLQQGETERAGALATEALEIAAMNDLKLRKVSGLLLLAEVHFRRNQPAAARPLLEMGSRMAKASNSHFSLARAQALGHQMLSGLA